jgi:hypothetical protein
VTRRVVVHRSLVTKLSVFDLREHAAVGAPAEDPADHTDHIRRVVRRAR